MPMCRASVVTLILAASCSFASPFAYADTGAGGAGHEAAAGHEQDHDFHRNFAGLFIGGAGENRRDKGFALGVEYARNLTQHFSIGAIVEHTFGDLDFWVIAVPFAYRTGPWKFFVAPGVEDSDLSIDGEFLVRLGVEYAFKVGDWEIAPQLDADFIDGDRVAVFGVVIGKSF